MKRSYFILGSLAVCLMFSPAHAQTGTERPNIVYIMADDLGYGDLHCYNKEGRIPTPNIDALAAKGVMFSNAHSSDALCTPSRFSVLTGRYCWRTKLKKGVIFDYSQPLIEDSIMTIAQFLRDAGYHTAAFGKWHQGFDWRTTDGKATPFKVSSLYLKNIDFKRDFHNGPLDHGFDYYFGIPGSNDMGPYLYIENRHVVGDPDIWATKENFPMMRGQREGWMTRGYNLSRLDSNFTEHAKRFIREQEAGKPFFMYFAASAPHYPYDVPAYAKGKSKAGDRGDMVYVFDRMVGELVKTLKEQGMYKNTVIIIASDNGPLPGVAPPGAVPDDGVFETYGHKSMGHFKGFKGNVFEGGHRVPLIVSWPGKAVEGRRVAQEVCLVDIFGLIGQLVHRTIPRTALDSYGFLPLVTDRQSSFRRPEPIVSYAGGVYSVQDYDGWKYVHENKLGGGIFPWKAEGIVADPVGPVPGSEGMLFDLKNDPGERHDVYSQYPGKVRALSDTIRKIIQKQAPGTSRPNVLVILTDDQRFSTIHALGNQEIITPNMDKLVREGTAFTQAHIQGGLSGAICCPSRAMLMSGRDLFHLHKDGAYVPSTDTTFPELFRANGYITFETGKWHQDEACYNRSFTTGDNIMFGGMNPPETGGQYRPRLHHYDSSGQYKTPFWGEDFSSIYFADAAVDFLHWQQDSRQPFLMYVAFTSPHDPRTPPTWYGHSYRPEDVSLPADYLPEHPFDNGELVIRDETLLPFPRPKEAVRTEIAKYYSMISEVDYQIGRILDALKQTGRDKNTIIVFAGDNGLAVGEHGLLGKQNPYECSIRVPLVFAGKGIPADKRINGYVYLNDIYPTLCEMTGIKAPHTVEGQSMAGAFSKQGLKGRDHVFFAYLNLQRAVVKDGFKLVRYNVNGQDHLQLFDLKADPYELRNLADQQAFGHIRASLTVLLSKTMKEEGDFCDPDKPGWGAPKKWTPEEVMELHP